jgi:ubiquinone/menaquinone biosynthesis C-methylase UbiE
MPDPGWWEALWPDPASVLIAVGLRPNMDVVDLCSGDGWFTLQIAKLARQVIALDIDSKLLETARVRLAEAGVMNCRFIEADAYDIARVVSDPVDYIFLANAFHGVPDKVRLSREVRSILKPGGLFGIVNWHARPREETMVLGEPRGPATELRIDPATVRTAVEAASLRLARLTDILPYHYAAIFEKPA